MLLNVHTANASDVRWIGSGHWSDCFAFEADGADLVVRVGANVEDFRKDKFAAGLIDTGLSNIGLSTTALPVPQVLSIGAAGPSLHYAISQRVPGTVLEQIADWPGVIASLVNLLESLRSVNVASFKGWGRWDQAGSGEANSWRNFLLSVDQDPPHSRVHGWRRTLERSAELTARFAAGYDRLEHLATNDVPRSLVHNDLFNRNVHVVGSNISGVFDWGNSMIGDHLYDLGILCFWEPWWEHAKYQPVLRALQVRWSEPGQAVDNFAERMEVCLLHVGLEHIAYHCSRDDLAEAERVANRIDVVGASIGEALAAPADFDVFVQPANDDQGCNTAKD